MTSDLFDRDILKVRLVENFPGRLGAGQTRFGSDLAVFAVSGSEFDLGVKAEDQPRNRQPPIIHEKSQCHKLLLSVKAESYIWPIARQLVAVSVPKRKIVDLWAVATPRQSAARKSVTERHLSA